jgi:hypothetical protein
MKRSRPLFNPFSQAPPEYEDVLIGFEGSITKWTDIILGKDTDRGQENCTLCQVFSEYECSDCPIGEKTGQNYCGGSPHSEWYAHHVKMMEDQETRESLDHFSGQGMKIGCYECYVIALRELRFLIELQQEYIRRQPVMT